MTRKTRRTNPTPDHEENTAMNEDPIATAGDHQPSSPLLSAVPRDLLTDDLVAEVQRASQAAAQRQTVTDSIAAATAAVRAALEANDVSEAISAAGVLLAAERVSDVLPSPTLDPAIVADVLHTAGSKLATAEHSLPPLPTAAYMVELAQYRAMNGAAKEVIDPPVFTPADRAAVALLGTLTTSRERLVANVATWRSNMGVGDLRAHLAAAGSLLAELAEHRADVDEIAPVVDSANEVRHEAGLTWTLPDLIPGFITH